MCIVPRRRRILGKNILENGNKMALFELELNNAKLSIWNRVAFPFGGKCTERRGEKGGGFGEKGKTLEMDSTSWSGGGDLSRRPVAENYQGSDGKRDELRDFPRGSNRKSVFW